MPATVESPEKIGDIEVLRAVAICMTLIGHLGELLFWGGSFVIWSAVSMWGGVDLFFCISGFVIARSLIRAAANAPGWPKFVQFAVPFWIRRVFRIWPAAFFWVAVSLTFAASFNAHHSFGNFGANLRDGLSAILQVANLHYLDCLYFKEGSCNQLLGIYWSLSLEEQFYIVLPFFLFLVPPRFWRCSVVIGILLQLFLKRPPWAPMWAVRTDTLMWGILIAMAVSQGAFKNLRPSFLARPGLSWMTFAVGVALIPAIAHDKSTVTGLAIDHPFVWFNTGLLAIVCAAMVFIASFDACYIMPQGMLRRLLLYIGSRSYALYLCHNCIFYFTRELFATIYGDVILGPAFTLRFIIVAFGLSLAAAEGTYRFIETPLRRRGRIYASEFRSRLSEEFN